MKLQKFDGGLQTRLVPQRISTSAGVEYENIDNASGVLRSVKGSKLTDIDLNPDHVYFDAAQEWVEFDRPTDSVEYQGVLYFTDGINTPKKYDGTDINILGIAAPSNVGTQTVIPAPAVIKSVEAEATEVDLGAGIRGTEVHYYLINTKAGAKSNALYIKVTKDGVETVETSTSELVYPTVTDVIPKKDLHVNFANIKPKLSEDGMEVYRYYDNKWYLVRGNLLETDSFVDDTDNIAANTELLPDSFANLSGVYQYVLTYYDNDKGIESAPSPVTDELDIDEDGGAIQFQNLPVSTDPQVDQKKLYRVGGANTVFSLVTTLDNSVRDYTDSLGDAEIDGATLETENVGLPPIGLRYITEAYAMLFGALGTRLYFTPIGEPDNWPSLYFLEFSREITGIAPVGSGIIVFSKYDAEIVTGTGPESLSKVFLAGDQGCLSHNSIQPLGNGAIWMSTDGICMSAGGPVQVISKDALGKLSFSPKDSVVHDQVYYVLDSFTNRVLAADLRFGVVFKEFNLGVSQLSVGDDTLYGWDDGTLVELFASDVDTMFKYLSPRFIEGQATHSKLYKSVYFYIDGDIIIDVYINDVVVLSKSFKGKDNFELKVPQDDKRGFHIQFGITGTGTVYEIFWEADSHGK